MSTEPWQPSTHVHGTLDEAREVLRQSGGVVALTGAGVSTASGVPDYRGPTAMRATPMMYEEFVHDPAARRRYWARNFQGWAYLSGRSPNPAHLALARWEGTGRPAPLVGIVSQNVDGLHEAAGSRRLISLHGRSAQVICLRCGEVTSRQALQERMAVLNPDVEPMAQIEHAELRPDADAVVDDWQGFEVPDCQRCGGTLKPDVAFFGEPVPKHRVAVAAAWCEAAGALLVAGSSLTVMSGLRFARAMARKGRPIVIINHGKTRADELATVRLDLPVDAALPELVS